MQGTMVPWSIGTIWIQMMFLVANCIWIQEVIWSLVVLFCFFSLFVRVLLLRASYVQWTEYEFGLNGNKPAKAFTVREKGKIKYSYSLRKPFWTLVQKMKRCEYTHTSSIEKIESIYSAATLKSITQILREIISDKWTGGHQLRCYNWI